MHVQVINGILQPDICSTAVGKLRADPYLATF